MANNVDEDFEEEEVWATLVDNGIDQPTPKNQPTSRAAANWSPSSDARMMIPCGRRVLSAQSTPPVSIRPDWSKILERVQGSTSHGEELGGGRNDNVSDGDDDEDDGDPPHEWLAKKMAKTHISSSVCEGSGRTLKGRDLSKVRNAVLTKTGFLEEEI
ncbi:uncharacterized protein LOC122010717 [Zingiber officinale]|uniref:Senescence regulator n=1 Tax=Zingiber officinale TaxID=94328 RepID=A0A8J5FKI3_ZINOF|nr:uncharacterized protein LOC122010717 [Zingiber officinale]KAG6486163.1 hypothetical protein ZIOFF_054733 [Zingiber officinale]